MTEQNQSEALVPVEISVMRNKTSRVSAIRRAEDGAADYVPHVSLGDIRLIVTIEARQKRHGERNAVLIKLIYDAASRCSEGIGVRPCDIVMDSGGWTVNILGKGARPGKVAISPSLAAELQSYCYRHKIPETGRIFPISRSQCFRIVCNAFDRGGVRRPTREKDRVGAVHILRHSGAIERLRQTGNPKALQDQLRHRSAQMTLRYLKTVSTDESLRIQQEIDFKW